MATVTVRAVEARCPPKTAVIVVVPAESRLALALPLLPEIVATAGSDELQATLPSTILPSIEAVNCSRELLSCRGLLGETVNRVAPSLSGGRMSTRNKAAIDL
jgi:hypothetical protein